MAREQLGTTAWIRRAACALVSACPISTRQDLSDTSLGAALNPPCSAHRHPADVYGIIIGLDRGWQDGEREFFIDNLLVRIHCIIVMIRWTGLAPWEFEFPFPGDGEEELDAEAYLQLMRQVASPLEPLC